MGSTRRILFLALTVVLTAGIAAPSGATPVVDQYTEQLPTPGGEMPIKPGNPVAGGTSGTSGEAGNGTAYTYVTPDGRIVTLGGSSVGKKGQNSPAEDSGNGSSSAATESSATGIAASADEVSGDGMGWLFPASLVLVTGIVVGFAIGRRNRGTLAT